MLPDLLGKVRFLDLLAHRVHLSNVKLTHEPSKHCKPWGFCVWRSRDSISNGPGENSAAVWASSNPSHTPHPGNFVKNADSANSDSLE